MSLEHFAKALAKPFKAPVRIGVDVCHIPRIQRMISKYGTSKRDDSLALWLARCFRREELKELRDWMSSRTSQKIGDRVKRLAGHLAGRWAVKEAAIKAHHARHLYPYDVWIRTTRTGRPEILIAPTRQAVTFTSEVAKQRGLGETKRAKGAPSPGLAADASWLRLYRPTVEKFQRADGSISHDGDYAFATVQAIEVTQKVERFVADDGDGEPMHVPTRGDPGYDEERFPTDVLKAFLTTPDSKASSEK